jgi:hypothetical protein
MHTRIRKFPLLFRPCRRKLGHRCIPDLACTQPARGIYTASRKIDLLSKTTLLCFTCSSCFVVYLSVVTASICAGSVKHVSAAMPAFPKPGTQALRCRKVGERNEGFRLLPRGTASPVLCTVEHRACPNHGCGIHANM